MPRPIHFAKGFTMAKRSLQHLLKLSVARLGGSGGPLSASRCYRSARTIDRTATTIATIATTIAAAITACPAADRPVRHADVIDDAVQQYLNPGLAGLPGLHRRRGRAVAAQPGRHDAGGHHRRPELALQAGRHRRCRQLDAVHLPLRRGGRQQGQARADAGDQADELPRRPRLLAGRQHALRRGRQRRRGLRLHQERRHASRPPTPIALGHFPPGATGSARNKGVGISVQPNASGMDISADGSTLVVANNYNDSISVIDTATRSSATSTICGRTSPSNEGRDGGVGGTFPFAVVDQGQRHGVCVVGSRPRSRGRRRVVADRRDA